MVRLGAGHQVVGVAACRAANADHDGLLSGFLEDVREVLEARHVLVEDGIAVGDVDRWVGRRRTVVAGRQVDVQGVGRTRGLRFHRGLDHPAASCVRGRWCRRAADRWQRQHRHTASAASTTPSAAAT
ncbi:hypothetical protein D3C87_1544160 [compost metagenome]